MANMDIETLENSFVPFKSIPNIFSHTSGAATAVAMALRQRRVTASGDFFGSKMALAQGEQLQTIPPKLRNNSVNK